MRMRNLPLLAPLNLPPLGGDSTFSGPLLTKTLLIYALTTGGTNGGPRLVAYDKASGQGTRVGRSARLRHRHADDLHGRRQAVHRAHRGAARTARCRNWWLWRYRDVPNSLTTYTRRGISQFST